MKKDKSKIKYGLKNGFTLAEILLTLTIIGVIASLTIPDLITDVQKQQTVTALKTAYSILSIATNEIIDDYNGNLTNKFTGGTPSDKLVTAYAQKLKVIRQCANAAVAGTCEPDDYVSLDGTPVGLGFPNSSGLVLANGMLLLIDNDYFDTSCSDASTSFCALVMVDINGFSGPNTWGKDLFSFYLSKNKLAPSGATGTYGDAILDGVCNPSLSQAMVSANGVNGEGCAYRILLDNDVKY